MSPFLIFGAKNKMSKVILNKYVVFEHIMAAIEAMRQPRITSLTVTDGTSLTGKVVAGYGGVHCTRPKIDEWLKKVAYKWLCQAATEATGGTLDEIVIYNLHAVLRMRHKAKYDINALHVYVAHSQDTSLEAGYVKALNDSYRSDTGQKFVPSLEPLWIREGSFEHKALLEPTKHTFHKLEIGSHTVSRVLVDLVDFFKANYDAIPDKVTLLTFEEASRKSHEWHEVERRRKHKEDLIQKSRRGTRKLIYVDEDFAVFDLADRVACSYEGSLMGHCVGSYHHGVTAGEYKIFHFKHLKAAEKKEINDVYTVQAAYSVDSDKKEVVRILQNKSRFNAYPSEEVSSQIEAYLNSPKLMAYVAGKEDLPVLDLPDNLEEMETELFKSYAGKSKFESKPFDLLNPFTGRSVFKAAIGNSAIMGDAIGFLRGWSTLYTGSDLNYRNYSINEIDSFVFSAGGVPFQLNPKIEYAPHRLETTKYREGSFHNFGEPPIIGELRDEYDRASTFLHNRGSSRSTIVQALVHAFSQEDPVCWGTPQIGMLTSPYQSVKDILANHGAKVIEVVDKVRWEWYLDAGNFYFTSANMFCNVMPNSYVMPYHIKVPVQLAPDRAKSSNPGTTKRFNAFYDPKSARKLRQAEKNALSGEAGITHDPFVTLFFGGHSVLTGISGNTYSTANADALRTDFVKEAVRKSLASYLKSTLSVGGFYYPNAQAIGRLSRRQAEVPTYVGAFAEIKLEASDLGDLDAAGKSAHAHPKSNTGISIKDVSEVDRRAAKLAFFGALYGRKGAQQ